MRSGVILLAGAATILAACNDLPESLTRAPGSATPIMSVQAVLVGGSSLTPPAVLVRDHQNVPMEGVSVQFSVVSGAGSIGTSSAITDASGIASVGSWTMGNTGETNVVAATVDGISGGPIQFTARVVSIAQITGGSSHTCAVAGGTGGEVFCWGSNSVGQAGLPDAVGTNVNIGRAYASGMAVAEAGFNHTCALNSTGTPLCWGRNNAGQLGDGSTTNHAFPGGIIGNYRFTSLAVGADHACGLVALGDAYCWGLNANGQLGDGTIVNRLAPVAVSGGLKFQEIAARGNHTCALSISSNLTYCWGENLNGGLGDGTTTDRRTPTAVSGGQAFQSLALGNLHSCGMTNSGAAYCWGANGSGQLGDGTTTERLTPTAVSGGLVFTSMSARGAHTCGVAADGLAYCWGDNANGQLGDGTKSGRLSPVAVSDGVHFIQVAAGGSHTCGVTPVGQAFCWGVNSNGQLGDGSFTERLTPTLIRVR